MATQNAAAAAATKGLLLAPVDEISILAATQFNAHRSDVPVGECPSDGSARTVCRDFECERVFLCGYRSCQRDRDQLDKGG